jgi:branched-chain amino acid transport system ATP-binding protein
MQPLLEVKKLTMDFGGLRAIDSVDFNIYEKEIVALIGPNGAGKTTFFNCITGIYNPTAGDIFLYTAKGHKKRLNGLKPNKITELGLARTFQNIRLFKGMTVLENVMIGRHCRTRANIFAALIRSKKIIKEEYESALYSYHILERLGLEKFANEIAENLPYGEQRKLEIARALATEPKILLLDEPAAGLNPQETENLIKIVKMLRDENGISVLLIEHDMGMVMKISERITVMDYGKKIAEGTPKEIKENPEVIKAYLGEELDVEA